MLCDGSARFVSETIELATLKAMASRKSDEIFEVTSLSWRSFTNYRASLPLCTSLAMHHGRIRVFLLTLSVFASGCQQDATVARVDGVVRLDGKPLTTGTVRFVPEAGRAATGEIQSDGTLPWARTENRTVR